MKHNIRQKVLDPVRGLVTKVVTIDGELGSGILDRNGQEIFEGDIVAWQRYSPEDEPYKVPISFHDGCFWVLDIDNHEFQLKLDKAQYGEVVGHD